MRKEIYKAIAERLSEKVTEIKFISVWNNNIAVLSGGAVWPRPAVFIEFETIEWGQQGNRTRRGDVAVRLHIITDAVVYNGNTDVKRQEKALEYFDLLDQVNAAIQGLQGENFSPFMLTSSATNHDHAELIENVERYVTSAQDTTAMDRNMQQRIIDDLRLKRA